MQTLGSAECGVAKVKGSDVARNIFGGTAKGALRRFPLAEIRGGAKTACGGFLDHARAEPLASRFLTRGKRSECSHPTMEPFDWIIGEVTTTLGGKPGSRRWEVVTACFGWAALISLLLGLGSTIVRYKSAALYGISGFSALLWIALKRDFKKLKNKQGQ